MTYKKIAKLTLSALFLITLFFGLFLKDLRFDYDFESFFPVDDPDLDFYNEFQTHFSNDNEFILIGIENKQGIFHKDFLSRVDSLTSDLKKVENLNRVQSPTGLSQFVAGSMGGMRIPLLHIEDPSRYPADSLRIYSSPDMVNSFFAGNAKSLSIMLLADKLLSKEDSDQMVRDINSVLKNYSFDDIHISGRIFGQDYFVNKMQTELIIFTSLGIVMLVVFLIIAFRSFWGVWVPLVVVALSLLWLLGFMTLTVKPLDIMTVLLPTILFVVGVSDVVHILTRYLAELRKGKSKNEAVKTAFKQVGLATFLTSLTTAGGFLTLLTANIQPIKDFGLYTAAGVFIAFILAFTLLPSILILKRKPVSSEFLNSDFWYKPMHRLFLFTLKYRKSILGISGILVVLAGMGITRLEVDNYLLNDLGPDDPHRKDFEFFEENYAGVRPFEMALILKDSGKTLFDYDVVKELDQLETYLKRKFEIGFVVSPLTYIKTANRAINAGKPEAYAIPENKKEHKRILKMLHRMESRKEFQSFIDSTQTLGRINAKVEDYGGKKMMRLTHEMRTELPEIINTDLIDVRMTGMGLLLDKNNKNLAEDMLLGLLIAFTVVGIIMGILYKSPKIVIATLIPNIMPLIFIAAIMYLGNINLNVSTAIIFTIAFGIAVDDTIHYMSKLKLELHSGKSFLYALKTASITTGKAITVTSIILVSGFITLLSSSFASTFYVGLLVSITLFLAVIIDLVVLPALLITIGGTSKQKM